MLLKNAFEYGKELSQLEKEGVIQRFEYTFELAWKTLKDYLEYSGIILKQITPKEVIKTGFESKILPDGDLWIEMLAKRNLLSHTYSQEVFANSIEQIRMDYVKLFAKFYNELKGKIVE